MLFLRILHHSGHTFHIVPSNRDYELGWVMTLLGFEQLESQETLKPRPQSKAERVLFCWQLPGKIYLIAVPIETKHWEKQPPGVWAQPLLEWA